MVQQRTSKRVVIVGGGIAGPVLGMFLKRVGIDAVVCEKRSRDTIEEGLFLGVAPNGMNVLAELDLARHVEAVSLPCHGFEFRNARDQVIATIDRANDRAHFGSRLQMIRRSDLHEALTAAARARGVAMQFGRTLVAIDRSRPAKVVARFADGSEEAGDALVGCDGINSTTRQLILPDSPMPAYSGLLDFGGFAHTPHLPVAVGLNVMVFGRRAFFGAFKTPTGDVWWFHNGGEKKPQRQLRGPSALRAHILELHRDDPQWIHEVVDSTATPQGPFALNDILSMPRWHLGRVCLLGDAAHATTPSAGQGASLALEDAMVAAQCLRDIDDPERAFAAFECARRARVEEIVRQSRRIGNRKAVSGPIAEWVRDRLLPHFLRLGERTQARMYSYRIGWEHSRA